MSIIEYINPTDWVIPMSYDPQVHMGVYTNGSTDTTKSIISLLCSQ